MTASRRQTQLGELGTLLIGLGASTKLTLTELASKSEEITGRRVPAETWRRMTEPVDRARRPYMWEIDILRAVADTLRGLNAEVTLLEIVFAVIKDMGYPLVDLCTDPECADADPAHGHNCLACGTRYYRADESVRADAH